MKKIISIMLIAMLLISMTLVIGSAANIDRKAGAALTSTAYLTKGNSGNDTHFAAGAAPSAVYIDKLNLKGENGDCVVLTGDVFSKVGDSGFNYQWWKGVVLKYNISTYYYEVTELLAVDTDKTAIEIPEDGFVVLTHNYDAASDTNKTVSADWATKSAANWTAMDDYAVGDKAFIQGIATKSIEWNFYKTDKAPVLDGVINDGEYGAAITEINPDNGLFDYRGFDAADKYATGTFYATYDDEYLYLAWDIASEIHNCPVLANPAEMWSKDCVQINISTISPNAEENYQHALNWLDGAAVTTYMYQIGACVNDDGDTQIVTNWMNDMASFEAKVIRDDDAATTVYEVKIPVANLNDAGYELSTADGTQMGVAFSINTNDGTNTRVVRLRDGGGIYGSNDFSKTPVVNLMGKYVAPVESTADDTSDGGSVPTGDSTIAIVASLAVLSIFGLAVVVKKAR